MSQAPNRLKFHEVCDHLKRHSSNLLEDFIMVRIDLHPSLCAFFQKGPKTLSGTIAIKGQQFIKTVALN